MNEVIQNRSSSNNKSQDIIFIHETHESMIIKERINSERLSHKARMKASQNQETSEILSQDNNIFRNETPNSFSTKNKHKSEQQKFMRELRKLQSLPSKSQPEPRPNGTLRSNSLPNNHTPSSEFCYSNSVSNISWDETHPQNLFSHQLTNEPETYNMQTLGRNNEAYDDNKVLIKNKEMISIILDGGIAYPNHMPVYCYDNNLLSGHAFNEFTVPQSQVNDPFITQSIYYTDYSD
ncbi:21852_t:CDS:2, partial [Gigaspora rosea]